MKNMCIAAPAQIVKIDREENRLFADFGGARQQAKIDLLPEVEKLSEEAAKESLEAWEELLEILEEEDKEMEKARIEAGLNQ